MRRDELTDMILTAAALDRQRRRNKELPEFQPITPREAAIKWARHMLKRVHADWAFAERYVEISERHNVPVELLIVFIRFRKPSLDGWALWCAYYEDAQREKEERLNAPAKD